MPESGPRASLEWFIVKSWSEILLSIWFVPSLVFVESPFELLFLIGLMLRLKLSDTLFTRPPIENIGFIDPKYYSLVDEGHPIVKIRESEMRGLGLPYGATDLLLMAEAPHRQRWRLRELQPRRRLSQWPAPLRSIATSCSGGDGHAFNRGCTVPIHVQQSRCQ